MRMCGIDSAELIWLVIAVSFFRNSSSRSSDEDVACTVISWSPKCWQRIALPPPPPFADTVVPNGGEWDAETGQNRGESWLIDRINAKTEASEAHVKRIVVVLFALLISTAAFALDDRSTRNDRDRNANVVDEVMRMWKANVAEDDIIAYVHKADTRFTVTADDVIAMSDAKVPRTVIKAVLDEADYRGDRSRPV